MSWKRTKCVVSCCQATPKDFPDRKFLLFPKRDTILHNKWIEAVGATGNLEKRKRIYICSNHFQSGDFGRRLLKRQAYPTLNLSASIPVIDIPENLHFNPSTVKRTYSRKMNESTDILPEELNVLSEELNDPDTCLEFSCHSCLKKTKAVSFYMKLVARLKKELKRVKCTFNNKMKAHKALKLKYERAKKLNNKLQKMAEESIDTKINSLSEVNENSKIFAKLILSDRQKRPFSEDEKWICQSIYFRSAAGYDFLRDCLHLNLPHTSSLHRWTAIKNLSPGPDVNVLSNIQKEVAKLSAREKEMVLIFDEMSIQTNLTYNKYKDKIDGFVDYGDDERSNVCAKSVCVFMLRSIGGKFKQPLYYISSPSNTPAQILEREVDKVMEISQNLGLNIRAICCDQGPTNRKLFNTWNITRTNTSFQRNGRTVYAFFDYPHLFKSIRNRLLKGDLCTDDGVVSWKIIVFLYNYEKNSSTKICPKLTYAHVNPNNFQKMSVKLSIQVLSRSVSVGIETFHTMNKFPKDLESYAIPTAKFIHKMNMLFDMMNGKPPIIRTLRSLPLFESLKNYLLTIRPVGVVDKAFCFQGLAITIQSLICLSRNLFDEHADLETIYGNKLNQDPLENLYGQIRGRNMFKPNPNIYEFGCLFAKVLSIRFLFHSKFSNCEEDGDELLRIDWDTILKHQSHEPVMSIATDDKDFIDVSELISADDLDSEKENMDPEETCTFSAKIPDITDLSTRYFAGYCFFKSVKRFGQVCQRCVQDNCKTSVSNTIEMSEVFIKLKEFEHSKEGNILMWPTEKYFNICQTYVKIFTKYFEERPFVSNVKQHIVERCKTITNLMSGDWFDENHPCYPHRLYILDIFIVVLLWKNCKWVQEKNKTHKDPKKANRRKLANISNM